MNGIRTSAAVLFFTFFINYQICVAAGREVLFNKYINESNTVEVTIESLETNKSMAVIQLCASLKTNGQTANVLWMDSIRVEKEKVEIITREYKELYDVYYDSEQGVFICARAMMGPISMVFVKCPPYPGKYEVEPKVGKLSESDYAWCLGGASNQFRYIDIKKAQIKKENKQYYVEVETVSGRKRLFKRTSTGWHEVNE